MELLAIFKGLSDPVRLRIFYLLIARPELCVCHLTDALQLPQSTVSRHLNILKQAGVVQSERRGQWVYYRLSGATAVQDFAGLIEQHDAPDMRSDIVRLSDSVCTNDVDSPI